MAGTIKRALVWSARLRWTYGVLSASTVLLLFTAWLGGLNATVSAPAKGYHLLLAYIFTVALGYRIFLLFTGKGSERLADCLPKTRFLSLTQQHLRFYFSLGKTPLDGWFAHNPFWGPLHCAFLVLAFILILTGFAIGKVYLGANISITGIHAFLAGVVLVYCIALFLASLLHDIKAEANSISAMLSGYKYFKPEAQPQSSSISQPMTFIPNPNQVKEKR
jgi:Ni,Fe-hydrogenase I cytochrome b subunit